MPAGEWRGPQRREFSAADPELMRWVIGQVYGGVCADDQEPERHHRVCPDAC